MKLPKIFASALFFSIAATSAEMVFESRLVEITVKPGQKVVTGNFPFEIKNGSATVVSYDAKCTCLAARLEPLNPDRSVKLVWKEGDAGRVMTQFDTSQFLGTVEKAIELNLEGQKKPTILTVRIHVPELIKMEPSSLKWDKGGEAGEKVMKITINHDKPIRIVKHRGNNDKIFPYKLVTIRDGWEYEIRVKPTDLRQSGMGMISVTTDCEFPRFQRAAAYAVIRPSLKRAPVLTQ
jgi:hypothetical protein